MKKNKESKILDIIMIIFSIIWLIPVLWMIDTAIKPTHEIFTTPPKWIPEKFTLQHIKDVITN